MSFICKVSNKGLLLTPEQSQSGNVQRLLGFVLSGGKGNKPNDNDDLLFAIADLQALAEEMGEDFVQVDGELSLSHKLASALDAKTASLLSLPPLVTRTLKIDVEGTPGSPNFRLICEWNNKGRTERPQRTGCIVHVDGNQRIPLWMMEALDVADQFKQGRQEVSDWEALARFRQALDPGIKLDATTVSAQISITDFLHGLEVQLADSFSLSPVGDAEAGDFSIVPFNNKKLASKELYTDDITEADAPLSTTDATVFDRRVRQRGTLPAYRLKPGSYLVVDQSVQPVLNLLARKQKAPAAERKQFLKNPRAEIAR